MVYYNYCKECCECLQSDLFPWCDHCEGDNDDNFEKICENCLPAYNFLEEKGSERLFLCDYCIDQNNSEDFIFEIPNKIENAGLSFNRFKKKINTIQINYFNDKYKLLKIEKEINELELKLKKLNDDKNKNKKNG